MRLKFSCSHDGRKTQDSLSRQPYDSDAYDAMRSTRNPEEPKKLYLTNFGLLFALTAVFHNHFAIASAELSLL